MAEFHNVDGRSVRIVQLVTPLQPWWAVFYDQLHGDARNTHLGGTIFWSPVSAFALVEGVAGHGPEQDVVALVVSDLGEMEIAQDRVDFAGITTDHPRNDNAEYWGKRWRIRTKADELMGAMPPPVGNTFAQPFEVDP